METGGRVLIVNADDLGLHEDINRGIETAHVDGIVTSASLSAVGEAFEHAITVCRTCPELDIGVHLTLVEEHPLTDPSALGGLVNKSGRFPESHTGLVARSLSGRVSRTAVRRELTAQVEKVLEAGIRPTHLDAHQHVHLLPGIWPVVVALAVEYGIPWLRMPRFSPIGVGAPSPVLAALRVGMNTLQGIRRSSLGTLRAPDATPALGLSGHLTTDAILAALHDAPQGSISELVTHPGVTTPSLEDRYRWGYDWSGETAALTDPTLRETLHGSGFALHSFSGVAA